MIKRHLRFKLLLNRLHILGEVHSSFMVNHLWHIIFYFSTESQWTLHLQPFILINLGCQMGKSILYVICECHTLKLWNTALLISVLKSIVLMHSLICINAISSFNFIPSLQVMKKICRYGQNNYKYKERMQDFIPMPDREWGLAEVQSYHYASELCYIYGKFWTTQNFSLLL
jgi:hypothetical protein